LDAPWRRFAALMGSWYYRTKQNDTTQQNLSSSYTMKWNIAWNSRLNSKPLVATPHSLLPLLLK